ncbi:MAG: hypothetical protein L0H36_01795 [bacterium]|nr:hypothetical protein [bacterium]MDN5835346.1 hypothetical protein [bacterium]
MVWLIILGAIVLIFGLVVFRGAPYVPSHKKYVELLFDELVKLKPSDVVVDIGSGDGLILRQAAKRGARAVGIELNPILVLITKILSLHNPRVSVRLGDFWLKKLPGETTIVYVFGESRDINKIAQYVQKEADRLDREINFVSYGFPVAGRQPRISAHGYNIYSITPLHSAQT